MIKTLLCMLLISVAVCSYSQQQKRYRKTDFTPQTMLNKYLFIKADAIIYLTDSVGELSNKPTHLRISNYQLVSTYISVFNSDKEIEIPAYSTQTIPIPSTNGNSRKLRYRYKKTTLPPKEALEQYALIKNNFEKIIQEKGY